MYKTTEDCRFTLIEKTNAFGYDDQVVRNSFLSTTVLTGVERYERAVSGVVMISAGSASLLCVRRLAKSRPNLGVS